MIPLDEQIDYFKDKAKASKELFFQWLTDEYEDIVQSYRVALHREIQHVYRIYGKPLRDDVRADADSVTKRNTTPPNEQVLRRQSWMRKDI